MNDTSIVNPQRRTLLGTALKTTAGLAVLSSLPSVAMANNQQVVYGNNWMSALDDTLLLSDLTLPGTHDSASNIGGGLVQTQHLSIYEQLFAGVRYLDLRLCLTGGEEGSFQLYHGFVNLHQSFDEVLHIIKSFLEMNPSETVIICLKQEHSSFSDPVMGQAYQRHVEAFQDLIIDSRAMSTVGEARGHIVVVTRCLGVPGINYRTADVLDNYRISSSRQWRSEKWPAVKQHLFEARDADISNGKLWITTTSSTGALLWPITASQYMLPALVNYFSDTVHVPRYYGARFGVILIDFANPMLIDQIAALNFGKITLAS